MEMITAAESGTRVYNLNCTNLEFNANPNENENERERKYRKCRMFANFSMQHRFRFGIFFFFSFCSLAIEKFDKQLLIGTTVRLE